MIEAHVNSAQVLQRYEERILSDPMLEEMRDAGSVDTTYTAVIKALRDNKSKTDILSTEDNPCRVFASVWECLAVLDNRDPSLVTLDIKRLVVPMSKWKKLLKILHLSHHAMVKTNAAARSRYYWPNLKEECRKMTEGCDICKEFNQRPKSNPNMDPSTPLTDLAPFQSVGLDMFTWKGIYYLLVVDKMSGYIFVENMQKHASCKKATEKFKLLCLTYGMPREVRFDKGPQFSMEFEEFLTDIKVTPSPSSAGNSPSNGLAESAVKNAKLLLRKCLEEKTSYAETLCHFN